MEILKRLMKTLKKGEIHKGAFHGAFCNIHVNVANLASAGV